MFRVNIPADYSYPSIVQNALADSSKDDGNQDPTPVEISDSTSMEEKTAVEDTEDDTNKTDEEPIIDCTQNDETMCKNENANRKQIVDAEENKNTATNPSINNTNVTVPLQPSINNTNVTVPLQPSINNTDIQGCQISIIDEKDMPTNSSSTSPVLQLCKVVTNLNVNASKLKDNPLDEASSFTLVVTGNTPSETQSMKGNVPGTQVSYTVIVKNGNYKVTEMWGDNKVMSGKQSVDPICSAAGYRGTILPPEGGHWSYCVKLSADCAGTISVGTKTCTITNAAFE